MSSYRQITLCCLSDYGAENIRFQHFVRLDEVRPRICKLIDKALGFFNRSNPFSHTRYAWNFRSIAVIHSWQAVYKRSGKIDIGRRCSH